MLHYCSVTVEKLLKTLHNQNVTNCLKANATLLSQTDTSVCLKQNSYLFIYLFFPPEFKSLFKGVIKEFILCGV